MCGAKKFAKWDTVYIYEEIIAERRGVVMGDNREESLATNGNKADPCDVINTDQKNEDEEDDEPVAKRKKSEQSVEKISSPVTSDQVRRASRENRP